MKRTELEKLNKIKEEQELLEERLEIFRKKQRKLKRRNIAYWVLVGTLSTIFIILLFVVLGR